MFILGSLYEHTESSNCLSCCANCRQGFLRYLFSCVYNGITPQTHRIIQQSIMLRKLSTRIYTMTFLLCLDWDHSTNTQNHLTVYHIAQIVDKDFYDIFLTVFIMGSLYKHTESSNSLSYCANCRQGFLR